jgi:predicted Rossmann fold flavoprotein
MGATGFGYDLARQFGLRVVEPRPALVPLTFSAADRDAWCELSGVSAEVEASVSKVKGKRATFREKLLITHRGLSGPAILQISSYWSAGEAVALDLAPGGEVLAPLLAPNAPRDAAAALTAVRGVLPARWAERWMAVNAPPVRTLSNAAIAGLEQRLHGWQVVPAGTEGYAKAEVTAGGVATAELDPRTLEARKVPGLYFIGEVVDVTGWLGGYNFQWAWASGFCAGQKA